jgi:homoserine O-acetyltransferase
VFAADYPAPKEADWIAKDFRFHTGETIPELRLHYITVGDPSGEPVLILHGTAGSAASMLNIGYASVLFGDGQPLDAKKYFIIIPDALGAGKSAKPSDGMRAKFPHYDYDDMVLAQYRLLTEGLGLHHLRLVTGNSMGGMETWMWGEKYPEFMDALVPMASQPTGMSARNWMTRRIMIESIEQDPAWNHGDYTVQPPSLRLAMCFSASPPRAEPWVIRRSLRRERRPINWWTTGWPPNRRPTPTTSSGSLTPRAITTHRPVWNASRRACWRSTPPMTSAIHPRRG